MAFPHTRGKESGVGEKAGVFHGFSTGVLGKMGRGWEKDLGDGAGKGKQQGFHKEGVPAEISQALVP